MEGDQSGGLEAHLMVGLAAPLQLLLQGVFDTLFAPAGPSKILVLQQHLHAFLQAYLCNSSSHKASTQHTHSLHLVLLGRGSKGVFLQSCHSIENANQCLGLSRASKLCKSRGFVLQGLVWADVEPLLDAVEDCKGCWVVAIGVLLDHLLGLAKNHAASRAKVFQNLVNGTLLLGLGLQLSSGQFPGAVNGHGFQAHWGHHLVHQANFPGLVGAHVLPGEDHVQGCLHPHRLGQPLGACKTWQ
mmetsp:Transcript_14181/g.20882  ORF Transcript_14181/g.20882 Transcript_14181/m.20882 type:complete len:243 (-) Transcript_14181:557-1285(-)